MSQQNCPFCTHWNDQPELRIAEFEHTFLVLNRDQFFAGYCFLYTKEHVAELFQLSTDVRRMMVDEVTLVAEVLHSLFRADKINYELLGNMVPHIHWHIVPRHTSDYLWPRPIWSEPHEECILTADEYRRRIETIRQALP